jgi:predicted Zn-dependent peptidase
MGVDRSRLPQVATDPAFVFPTIVRHELPNGLRVRTVEHNSVPVITFVLAIDGGSGADPSGQEGLAALTADMVDEGTGALSAIDVSEALARIGAEYDVEVGADATLFTLTTLGRFAERGASILSDIVTRPALHEDDVARVRQLRLDRLRQMKDLPPAVAERAFLRLLYGTHPYGHLAIGADRSLRHLSREDVTRFHAATYRPETSVLIVAGAFDHAELLRTASQAFGRWRGGDAAEPAGQPAADRTPPADAPTRLAIVPREAAAQSELRIGHLSARRNTPDYAALLVMNAVLGGQFVSRVNLKLREEKGYTYGAHTGFDWHRGISPFELQVSVHTASTADAIRDALDELDAIRGRRPPTDAELTLAKASLTRGYPRNFETAQQVARSVAQLALYDLPDSYFEEFVPKVNAIAAADVVRAAERYVRPERLTTLVVGDHLAVGDGIDALGLGQAVVLPPDM